MRKRHLVWANYHFNQEDVYNGKVKEALGTSEVVSGERNTGANKCTLSWITPCKNCQVCVIRKHEFSSLVPVPKLMNVRNQMEEETQIHENAIDLTNEKWLWKRNVTIFSTETNTSNQEIMVEIKVGQWQWHTHGRSTNLSQWRGLASVSEGVITPQERIWWRWCASHSWQMWTKTQLTTMLLLHRSEEKKEQRMHNSIAEANSSEFWIRMSWDSSESVQHLDIETLVKKEEKCGKLPGSSARPSST